MDHLTVYTYSLPLLAPYKIRRGVVIEWPDGRWSEASPLEDWSSDRIEDVVYALQQNRLDANLPSLQFAMQARPIIPKTLSFCALLAGTPQDILMKASHLRQTGVQHVKLKLKDIPLESAIEITHALAQDFYLRIDFNCSLALKDALYFAKYCHGESIDFFEEPLQNSQELGYFPFPIALDESLREEGYETLIALPQVKALVIKPTMTGGLRDWERFGKPIVLSSSFESGIGIAQILLLAASHHLPSGIDTYRFFKEDLLEEPLQFEGGSVYLPNTFRIKRHLLNSI